MKAYVCTLPTGGQYHDVNGKVKFARKGIPITDADEKKMVKVIKDGDGKGNDDVVVRYGFEVYKGRLPGTGTPASENAKAMKKLVAENAALKEENDAFKAAEAKRAEDEAAAKKADAKD